MCVPTRILHGRVQTTCYDSRQALQTLPVVLCKASARLMDRSLVVQAGMRQNCSSNRWSGAANVLIAGAMAQKKKQFWFRELFVCQRGYAYGLVLSSFLLLCVRHMYVHHAISDDNHNANKLWGDYSEIVTGDHSK